MTATVRIIRRFTIVWESVKFFVYKLTKLSIIQSVLVTISNKGDTAMAVYKRQSKKGHTWEARIVIDGVSRSKGGFATKGEARRAEMGLKQDAMTAPTVLPDITLGTIAGRYLAFQSGKGAMLRTSSLKRAKSAWKALASHWASGTVSDITAGRIADYQTWRIAQVGPATVNQEVRTLRAITTWAVDRGLIAPFAWPNVTELREPAPANKVLLPGQDEKIQSINPAWLRDVALVLLQTGLRPGEALALTWADIDMEGATLTVRTSKTHKARIVPLSDTALEILKGRLEDAGDRDHVFVTSTGGTISTAYAGQVWGRVSQRLDIIGEGGQAPTLHSLRHTVATRLQRAGYSDSEIAALLGHSATAAVTRRYLHSSVSRLRALTGALDG